MTSDATEAAALVRAVGVLLRLNEEEQRLLHNTIKVR
jgi:hypothetical protein